METVEGVGWEDSDEGEGTTRMMHCSVIVPRMVEVLMRVLVMYGTHSLVLVESTWTIFVVVPGMTTTAVSSQRPGTWSSF